MKKTTRIRELFTGKKLFVMPGVVDAYEAKIVEASGFKAAYMSGGRTSSARGFPDAGFLTMNEMVANAHYIATALEIPILSDADTGYGNALNTLRTIKEFIYAGVGAVHIEDQVFPKRCGYMPGKQIIDMEEAAGKIRAAVDARNEVDPDFVVIARTDALGSVGGTLDEALRRSEAYRKAGADVSWIEGMKNAEELRYILERVPKPFLLIPVGIPMEERPSDEELEKMGVACTLYPAMLSEMTTAMLWEYLHDVNARGVAAQKEWQKWMKKKLLQRPLELQILSVKLKEKLRKFIQKKKLK